MALACNINRRGRWTRGISGAICLAAGGVIAFLAWPPGTRHWVVIAALILIGAFQLFEAGMGWCVVRALGMRTPL